MELPITELFVAKNHSNIIRLCYNLFFEQIDNRLVTRITRSTIETGYEEVLFVLSKYGQHTDFLTRHFRNRCQQRFEVTSHPGYGRFIVKVRAVFYATLQSVIRFLEAKYYFKL